MPRINKYFCAASSAFAAGKVKTGLSLMLQRNWVAAGAGVGAWMRAPSVDDAEGNTLAGADGEGTFLAISHCTLEQQSEDHEQRLRP